MIKFKHFQHKSTFNSHFASGLILESDLCFIHETKEIWTKGGFYSTGQWTGDPESGITMGSILQQVYPVGSIYISTSTVNPSLLFGFGEWVKIEDRFLLGSGVNFNSGDTGGEAEHTLTIDELPSHTHRYKRHSLNRKDPEPETGQDAYGVSNKTLEERMGTSEAAGGGIPHNNMPPYLVVNIQGGIIDIIKGWHD